MKAALLVCAFLAGVTPLGAQAVDAHDVEAVAVGGRRGDDNDQSLLEDVWVGATWGLYAGFAAGVVLAAESMATEPESMGAILVVAVPLAAVPVGAIAGAVWHGLGRDVPGLEAVFD